MKQLWHHLDSGELVWRGAARGEPGPHEVEVCATRSIVSSGTERMLLEFGRSSWLDRARQQPERVQQVLARAQAEGVLSAVEAVRGRLTAPLPLGYASAGVVARVGAEVWHVRPGQRVACNGPHAQAALVPELLCVSIPDGVSDDDAAFASLAAIALHGTRLARVELGERVLVVGLGLIGQLTIELLLASGCEVVGVDPIATRCARAASRGARALHPDQLSERGFDAALICANARDASPLQLAARACRRRGRLVLVGTAEITLDRALLYERELTVQVAASYGAGRYERNYEERGVDHPVEHVRWTAQRNMEAALMMMARGALHPASLIEGRAPFEEAARLYERLLDPKDDALALALDYPAIDDATLSATQHMSGVITRGVAPRVRDGAPGLGVIGAGSYVQRTFGPALLGCQARKLIITSRHGASAALLAERLGFEQAAAGPRAALEHPDVELIAILTRHDQHATLAMEALRAGKHVLVEKPLAVTVEELNAVIAAARQAERLLMVGFNRRFAPMTCALHHALDGLRSPRTISITVNAGALSPQHWLHDAAQGGRILGEACHFIDLARHLAGAPLVETIAVPCGPREDRGALITLRFADGSSAHISYLTDGPSGWSKERIEVTCAGRGARIEGWRTLRAWSWPVLKGQMALRGDKGHEAMLRAYLGAVAEPTRWPIALDELEEVSRAAIEAASQVWR